MRFLRPIEVKIKVVSILEIENLDGSLKVRFLTESFTGEPSLLASVQKIIHSPEDTKAIDLDLKNITYINSLGISEIINLYRLFKKESIHPFRMRLLNVSPRVNAILELVELNNIVEIQLQA